MQFYCFKGHFTFFAENAEIFFRDFIGKNAEMSVLLNLRKKSNNFALTSIFQESPLNFQVLFRNQSKNLIVAK